MNDLNRTLLGSSKDFQFYKSVLVYSFSLNFLFIMASCYTN